MTVPTNDQAVEIRDVTNEHGRMLIVDDPYVVAAHSPASLIRPEEWRIVVSGAALPSAAVRNEEGARAWLTFLARNLAR